MDTTALSLERLDHLAGHTRQCVFWELAPGSAESPGRREATIADPEFEKEAWLSRVLLEWGSCGRIARDDSGQVVGEAVYAPPVLTPRARCLPTSPVSVDAVVLTQVTAMGPRDRQHGALIRATLMASVAADLIRRGVAAVEAFGYVDPDADALADPLDPADLMRAGAWSAGPECTAARCMIPECILVELGFEIVAPHPRFPRYRMDLDRDPGWKLEVEAALDSLLDAPAEAPARHGAVRRPALV